MLFWTRVLHNPTPGNHPKSPGQRSNLLTVYRFDTSVYLTDFSGAEIAIGLVGQTKWCPERQCGVSDFRTVHWICQRSSETTVVSSGKENWDNPVSYIVHAGFEHSDPGFLGGMGSVLLSTSCLDKWYSIWARVLIHAKRRKAEQSWFGPASSGHGCNTSRKELINH